MENKSFLSLFESEKETLKEQLVGLTLPKDAEKIQEIVSNYLSKVFDSQGESRMNLTQSEDYILQAAMTLLSAQHKMASEFASMKIKVETKVENNQTQNDLQATSKLPSVTLGAKEQGSVLAGSAIGGIGGGLLFSTWGAVFGAIAGTALVLYCAANTKGTASKAMTGSKKSVLETPKTRTIVVEKVINVDSYLNIVKDVCASIDTLIDTYRAQINRVINKYESQEKPSLEREYKILLEGIQSLVGFARTHEMNEKGISKLKERIEDIAESLENYNLDVVNYDGTNEYLFDVVSNPNITENKMVYPAIVKEGRVVLNGKILEKK